jgi:predicted AAA+ superfamily ATPase
MNSSFSSTAALQEVRAALRAVSGLTLFSHVLEDTVAQTVLQLLHSIAAPVPDADKIASAYSRSFAALASTANSDAVPRLADAWQAYLIARILDDSNSWSTQVERFGAAGCAVALREQARRDLRVLQRLFNLRATMLWHVTQALVTEAMPLLHDAWVPWCDLTPAHEECEQDGRYLLSRRFAESDDWGEMVDMLSAHWARHGTGPLARYRVLRWRGTNEGGNGELYGVAYPDPTELHNLIGYEREQARLRTNTERFLRGLPAHHVLLYGAPGTGKSSTIKALVNAYADQGLRLVEVRKEAISDLPIIVNLLRRRAPHYLLFIDDLSFEEHETAYKVLKVLLEGTAEAKPENVLIYATTNRLNLIRENFADRGKPTEDVHWRDTMDEKHSLVHRFGLRITFMLPDQAQYLTIAEELAHQRQLDLPREELVERALRWERQHANRSGRVARQFVDELEAELKRANA